APHSLGLEQLEQGVERRQIPFPRAGQEARRPEIAGEAGLFLETPKEREALPGESDPDAGFVVLSDQGAAVARGAAGDVAFLEQDDVDMTTSMVRGDACPQSSAAILG